MLALEAGKGLDSIFIVALADLHFLFYPAQSLAVVTLQNRSDLRKVYSQLILRYSRFKTRKT